RIMYGSELGLSATMWSLWTVGASGSYSKIEYENSKYTNKDTLQDYPLPDYHYSVGFYSSIQFNPYMGLTAGLEQANSVNRYGGIEYVVFDQETTQWYLSLAFSF